MALLLLIGVVPAAYLIGLAVLFFRGKRRGLAVSLGFFAVAFAAGWWSIFQSRSSTAGLGLLVLPFIAVFAGALGWAFRNLQGAGSPVARIASWACLVGAIAVIGWELETGRETVALNRTRDAQQRARTMRIDRNRAAVAQLLAQAPGQETAALSRAIREHEEDAEFLLPALESRFASPEDVDRLARREDMGLTSTALRNPNCPSGTLVRVYRTHKYPDYYLQPLAAHPNTPPELLREIHGQNPRRIDGLDRWLARNPATPSDVLEALSRNTDPNVIQGLLQNPGLTCAMLPEVARSLRASPRPDDAFSTGRLAELDARLCP